MDLAGLWSVTARCFTAFQLACPFAGIKIVKYVHTNKAALNLRRCYVVICIMTANNPFYYTRNLSNNSVRQVLATTHNGFITNMTNTYYVYYCNLFYNHYTNHYVSMYMWLFVVVVRYLIVAKIVFSFALSGNCSCHPTEIRSCKRKTLKQQQKTNNKYKVMKK